MSGCTDDGSDYDPVRERWASREALPSCGEFQVSLQESIKEAAKEGFACMRTALKSGVGAELKVTYPTVEGDLVTEYFRVTKSGTAEVYVDSTEDSFSDGDWSFAMCERPESFRDVSC